MVRRSKKRTRKKVVEVVNGWTHTCEYCWKRFEAKRKDARFCPRPKTCRERAYYARSKK